MKANSKIKYITSNQYDIIRGGNIDEKGYNQNGLTKEEQKYADENLKQATNGMKNVDDVHFSQSTIPIKGMVVVYDDFGYIKEIKNPKKEIKNSKRDTYHPLPSGTTSGFGVHVWGSYNNTLSVTTSQVRGVGRMTYFTDKIGENDNFLKKGDVATNGEMDNPRYGTQIYVTVQEADSKRYITQTMYKRDNGNLENAVLNIWKTGVEYFGYTYKGSGKEGVLPIFDPKDALYFYNR